MKGKLGFAVPFLVALVVLLVALAGARGGGKASWLYVYDDSYDHPTRIFGFSVSGTGQVTPLTGSPYTAADAGPSCGGEGQGLAYSRKWRRLFQGSQTGLTVWKVAGDGSLSEVAGSPFALGVTEGLWGTAVLESGRRLFVHAAECRSDLVHAYEYFSDDRIVELPGSPWGTGGGPIGLERTGATVLTADQDDNSVSCFRVAKDGTLTAAPGSPIVVAGADFWNVWTDAKGRFAYVADMAGLIDAFAVDRRTSALTLLPGSPYATNLGNAANGISFSKKGTACAVMRGGYGSSDVEVLSLEKDGSLLPAGQTQSSGVTGIGAHGFSADGAFFAVAGVASGQLATFRVDAATGTLELVGGASLLDAADVSDLLFAAP